MECADNPWFVAQSIDHYFAQDNPWIAQIHSLRITYIKGYCTRRYSYTYIYYRVKLTFSLRIGRRNLATVTKTDDSPA